MKRAGLVVAMLTLVGCGSSEEQLSPPTENPLPWVLSANPVQLEVGAAPTRVTLSGGGFIRSSQVRWNGGDRPTTYVSASELGVDFLPTDFATPATGSLVVMNAAPGGGVSGALPFQVVYPKPVVTGIAPDVVTVKPRTPTTSVLVSVTGTGFQPLQTYLRIGNRLIQPLGPVTSTTMQANVTSDFLATPGVVQVAVMTGAPGGGTSNTLPMSVEYALPTITSVTPTSAPSGSAFVLTVNGTGFAAGTMVHWNGAERLTTIVNATQVTAQVTRVDAASPATAAVSVVNPAPGGGTSNVVSFTVR